MKDIKTAQEKVHIISTLDSLQKLQDMRKLTEDRRTWKNIVGVECVELCKSRRTSYISKTKTRRRSSSSSSSISSSAFTLGAADLRGKNPFNSHQCFAAVTHTSFSLHF